MHKCKKIYTKYPALLNIFFKWFFYSWVYVAVDKIRCICSCLPLWNVEVLLDLLNVSHQVPGGVLLKTSMGSALPAPLGNQTHAD